MKKILTLAAALGFGLTTLAYADAAPAAAPAATDKPAASAPAKHAKKAHKARKHHHKAMAPKADAGAAAPAK